jgi:hypothetical protein
MERSDLLAELKTISGSNGMVTFRDMQKTASVVPTLIKIWITGNEWVKLHTDPITQRRIHVVYMPNPLEVESGGPYSNTDMHRIVNEQNLANFYYWLGNEYTSDFTPDKYMNSRSRQNTESYKLYTEATHNKSDRASVLVWEGKYEPFMEAMGLYGLHLEDVEYKINKGGHLVLAAKKLKDIFSERTGGEIISKVIARMASEREGNKRIAIGGRKQKYITVYGAPTNITGDNDVEPI